MYQYIDTIVRSLLEVNARSSSGISILITGRGARMRIAGSLDGREYVSSEIIDGLRNG